MLLACRLAGLSALEAHYAGVIAPAQSGASYSDVILRLAAVGPESLKPVLRGRHGPSAISLPATVLCFRRRG